MPAATATAAPAAGASAPAQPTLLVPFTRAAHEHIEGFADQSQLLDAASHELGPFDLPAYGFARGVILDITAAGGVGGAANVATKEDAPWSVIQEAAILDVNGAPIVGPLSGFDIFLIDLFGGYTQGPSADPRMEADFSAVATGAGASGNFAFSLRIPIEISGRDGLGSLANMNAASTYKLRVVIAPNTAVYSTPPATTQPTVRVQAYLDAWSQPTATDLKGQPNAAMPPAHGTTSFWSKNVQNIANGFATPRLPRVGNYIRSLIFVARDATDGTRATADANFPDPLAIYWDTKLITSLTKKQFRRQMTKRSGLTAAKNAAGGLLNGVFVYDFCHDFDGRVGWEMRDGYLPTLQSTRLELNGTFGASTALSILTNDISPAGEIYIG